MQPLDVPLQSVLGEVAAGAHGAGEGVVVVRTGVGRQFGVASIAPVAQPAAARVEHTFRQRFVVQNFSVVVQRVRTQFGALCKQLTAPFARKRPAGMFVDDMKPERAETREAFWTFWAAIRSLGGRSDFLFCLLMARHASQNITQYVRHFSKLQLIDIVQRIVIGTTSAEILILFAARRIRDRL